MKWLAIACSAVALTGCRTTAISATDLAITRVHGGAEKALKQSSNQGAARLDVRFNPAPCDCPPFEVFAWGRWTRAFFDVESPALEALRSSDPLAVSTLLLRFDTKRRAAENGVLYLVATPEP